MTKFRKFDSSPLKIISHVIKEGALLGFIQTLPWKKIALVLFIIFLPIAPDPQIQISEISATMQENSTSVLNQRQFGIIFSPSNLFLLVLLMILFYQLIKKGKRLSFEKYEVYLLIFFILAEISVFFSVNPSASFVWLLKLTYALLIYFVFSRIRLEYKDYLLIISAFLFTIFSEAVLAFFQFISKGLIGIPFVENLNKIDSTATLFTFANGSFFRAVGTFSHPNILSLYTNMLLPLVLLFYISNKFKRNIISLGLVLSALIVFFSLSRGECVVMLFSASLTLLFYKYLIDRHFSFKKLISSRRILFGMVPLLLIIIVFLLKNSLIVTRFLQIPESNFLSRAETLSEGFYILKNNPLGIGGGASSVFLSNYDYTQTNLSTYFIAPSHNFYLLMAVEIGIQGLIIVLLMLIEIAKQIFKRIRFLVYERKVLLLGFFVPLLIFFFNGLWEPRAFTDRIGFLFFLNLGLLTNIIKNKE